MIPAKRNEMATTPGSAPLLDREQVTDRDETRRTTNAILTAVSTTLNPFPDISGCPDTVARLAIPTGRDSGVEVWEDTLRLLALPYDEHPDYQPEWRL